MYKITERHSTSVVKDPFLVRISFVPEWLINTEKCVNLFCRFRNIFCFIFLSLNDCWYFQIAVNYSERISQTSFQILVVISPNVVELWEALMTFGFFFILIIVAYLVDIKIWRRDKACLNEEYQIDGTDDEKRRDDDIDTYLKKFADEMEFENNMVLSSTNL